MISGDTKLHVFNEYTILIFQFTIKSRLITHAHFLESEEVLVLGGVDGVTLFKLEYECHYDPLISNKIDPLGGNISLKWKLIKTLNDSPTWIKGLKVDEDQKVVHVWDTDVISFYHIPDFKQMCSYTELVNHVDKLNDILIIPKYRYFVICTNEAVLAAYKMSRKKELII